MKNKTINGVTIGDVFKTGKNTSSKVVDFYEVRSVTNNDFIKYICIAESNGLATNQYETPFSTVIRNKV